MYQIPLVIRKKKKKKKRERKEKKIKEKNLNFYSFFNYLHHDRSSHLRCSMKEEVFIFNINLILSLIDIDTESSPLFSFFVYERSRRPEVLCKKVLLKIYQNSQGNTCATPVPGSLF